MAVMITSMRPIAPEEKKPVNWITFDQAVAKSKTQARPIFIDAYTDWCGWCKVMDKNTCETRRLPTLLNEKFYAVKFNAEQHEYVVYNGKTYKFVASGRSGYHELAAALLNNQLSYPTVVFLDDKFNMIQPLAAIAKRQNFIRSPSLLGTVPTKQQSGTIGQELVYEVSLTTA